MQHVPADDVNGKLAELSPVITIWTLSTSATGNGIVQFPTELISIGPITGVNIEATLVTWRLLGSGAVLPATVNKFPVFWEYAPFPGKFNPHLVGKTEDETDKDAPETELPVSVKQTTPFIFL